LAALVSYYWMFRAGMTNRNRIYSLIGVAAAVGVIIPVFVSTLLSRDESWKDIIPNLALIPLEILPLCIAIFSFFLFSKGTLGRWWAVIAAGLILHVSEDLVFFYQSSQGIYYNGSLSDFLLIVAYLAFGASFYVHRQHL
jgi:hypothetical protein